MFVQTGVQLASGKVRSVVLKIRYWVPAEPVPLKIRLPPDSTGLPMVGTTTGFTTTYPTCVLVLEPPVPVTIKLTV